MILYFLKRKSLEKHVFCFFSMGDTHFMAMKQWGQPCDLVSDYPMVKQLAKLAHLQEPHYIRIFGGNSHGMLHMSLKSIYVFSILIWKCLPLLLDSFWGPWFEIFSIFYDSNSISGWWIHVKPPVFDCYFSRMRSKGSRFTLGVWGLRVCSLDVASTLLLRCFYVRNRSQPFATVRNRSQPFATVRNRSQPFATVRNRSQPFATVRNRSQPFATINCYIAVTMVSSAALQKGCFLEVSNVSLLRFAWQAWHFVTLGCVS